MSSNVTALIKISNITNVTKKIIEVKRNSATNMSDKLAGKIYIVKIFARIAEVTVATKILTGFRILVVHARFA